MTVQKIITWALGEHEPGLGQDEETSSDLWRPGSFTNVLKTCLMSFSYSRNWSFAQTFKIYMTFTEVHQGLDQSASKCWNKFNPRNWGNFEANWLCKGRCHKKSSCSFRFCPNEGGGEGPAQIFCPIFTNCIFWVNLGMGREGETPAQIFWHIGVPKM